MASSVKVIDRGANSLFKRAAALANKVEFGVGVPENSGQYESGAEVSTVAFAHEFGEGVPQRSFLRGWFDAKGPGWFGRQLAQMAQRSLVQGTSFNAELGTFGAECVKEIQERMDAGISPSLQNATVAHKKAKGSATPETPLEDTHLLRSKITWLVR